MMVANLSENEMKNLTPSELILLYQVQTGEVTNITECDQQKVAYYDLGYYDMGYYNVAYYNISYYDVAGYNDDNGRPER